MTYRMPEPAPQKSAERAEKTYMPESEVQSFAVSFVGVMLRIEHADGSPVTDDEVRAAAAPIIDPIGHSRAQCAEHAAKGIPVVEVLLTIDGRPTPLSFDEFVARYGPRAATSSE